MKHDVPTLLIKSIESPPEGTLVLVSDMKLPEALYQAVVGQAILQLLKIFLCSSAGHLGV